MNKTIPFKHCNFAKTNKFRESNTKFTNEINLLFFIFNQSLYSSKNYDIQNESIVNYIYTKYKLYNKSLISNLIFIGNLLNIHFILCTNRDSIKYLCYPYDKTRNFVIIYQHNDNLIPIMMKNGKFILQYKEICFIFHPLGKIQSSLRSLQYNALQKKAEEFKVPYRDKNGKKKSKIDLYEELCFCEDSIQI